MRLRSPLLTTSRGSRLRRRQSALRRPALCPQMWAEAEVVTETTHGRTRHLPTLGSPCLPGTRQAAGAQGLTQTLLRRQLGRNLCQRDFVQSGRSWFVIG